MADASNIRRALIVSGASGAKVRLSSLIKVLARLKIDVEICESVEDAAASLMVADSPGSHCVLVDSRSDFTELITTLREIVPYLAPILIADDPSPSQCIAAFRVGAGDVIELDSLSENIVSAALTRISNEYGKKIGRRAQLSELRGTLEEFLRDLVRTERRSLDLEVQLAQTAAAESIGETSPELVERKPIVLVVDDDPEIIELLTKRLKPTGVLAAAFETGEEGVAHSEIQATRGEPVDLAIVDAMLPGISGLETIAALRESRPDLPVLLMTGYSSSDMAESAADMGVTGYVLKPFDDIPALVERISEQATRSMELSRERAYLSRIKKRHEKVLLRYRQLAAAFNDLD